MHLTNAVMATKALQPALTLVIYFSSFVIKINNARKPLSFCEIVRKLHFPKEDLGRQLEKPLEITFQQHWIHIQGYVVFILKVLCVSKSNGSQLGVNLNLGLCYVFSTLQVKIRRTGD